MTSKLVFSGYARCVRCHDHKMTFQLREGCNTCKTRSLEYGVIHQGDFLNYRELMARVDQGEAFIDGTNAGLPITKKTFQVVNGIKPKRRNVRRISPAGDKKPGRK